MSYPKYSYFLAPKAEQDVVDIAAFGTYEWGELEATRYTQQFLDAFNELTLFPHLGQAVVLEHPHYRSWRVGSHIVFYRVDESIKEIEIVRILHARMDASRHLDRP